MKKVLAIVVALAAGCGTSDPCPVEPQFWTELGIGIYVEEGAAEWAYAPDLAERIDRLAVIVAEYADRDVTRLVGTTIVVRKSTTVDCGEWGQRSGCAHYETGWIDLGTGEMTWITAVECSVLGHEILHMLIGDPRHESPLWSDLSDAILPLVPDGAEFRPWTIDIT
jgi:hypothetical protein